jgi:lipoprotein NlpD
MMRALLLVSMTAALAGCAELYRWPDRMTTRTPARDYARDYERAPAEGHYVVKPGEALYSIAFRHQLDFRDLAVWNDIGPDYLIRPGQVLRLTPPPISQDEAAGSIRTQPLDRREPEAVPREIPPQPPVVHTWQWPTAGTVVKAFGNGNAKGVDIAGALGQQVLAAAPGKVVYSGSALKGYGELIIIKHDDLYLSAYGYNRRRLVDEGTLVAAGQPIAELGLGPEQKPVLHFEVREKGKPVNPLKLLPER